MHMHIILGKEMPMAALSQRVQLMLSPEQYKRLEALSDAEGLSIGALIRRAIDRLQGPPLQNKRLKAVRRIAAMPLPVGDWEQMERESVDHLFDAVPEISCIDPLQLRG
jgi:hypothetical protein